MSQWAIFQQRRGVGPGGLSRPIIKIHNIDTDENKTKEINCVPLHLHSLSFVLYPSTSEPSIQVMLTIF